MTPWGEGERRPPLGGAALEWVWVRVRGLLGGRGWLLQRRRPCPPPPRGLPTGRPRLRTRATSTVEVSAVAAAVAVITTIGTEEVSAVAAIAAIETIETQGEVGLCTLNQVDP
jgi:hypothetical protein